MSSPTFIKSAYRPSRYILFVALMLVHVPIVSLSQDQIETTSKADARGPNTIPLGNIHQILDHARRLADEARGLEPLDEIRLQARLADSVWPFDRSLAERLLSRSFELTIAVLKESSGADSVSSAADPQTLFTQISSIAARHDAKLEKKLKQRWQEALGTVVEKGNKVKPDPAQLASLLLRESASYLRSDEGRARQLFRQSVSLRVTQDHCFFLLNLRKRSADVADILFSDTLDALVQRPLSDANEVLMLSSYLFSPDGSITYVVISGYNTANATANMSAAPKNPALAKRYLGLLLAKVNANELVPLTVAHFTLKNLVPQYQVNAPEFLNDVYAKMATLLTSVSKDDSSTFDAAHKGSHASESEKTADWEKRFQNADKLNNEDWRDFEYFTILFSYVLPRKDFTRAALMVNKISNQELKEKIGDIVNLTILQAKFEKRETASSVSEADCNKLKIPLVRVMALSSLGHARLKQKATGDALRLFGQAASEANQIKDDQDRLQAKLMLVQLATAVDSSVGFEWAAGAFKEINKFSDFNMNRSMFSLTVVTYGLKNEIPINAPAPSSLVSAVAKLCRVNCEETLHLSGLLEKKETRLWTTFVALQTGLQASSRDSSGSSVK